MKIAFSPLNFSGVKPRYAKQNGFEVYPIAKDPKQHEIDNAISRTQDKSVRSKGGYNGVAFVMGQDVVKKYKGENAFSNDPFREIDMLDKMYDCNLELKNSQKGEFAFRDPKGNYYLVSTFVEGENPDPVKGNFNKENLCALVDEIYEMDKGFIVQSSSKNGYADRCRFMNYDFNGGNINISPKKAGLFDFEYSVIENLDDLIYRGIEAQAKHLDDANCHQSDTFHIPSSLRSFEFYTFCDYLRDTENPDKIFEDYLEIKGNYHKKMSDFYKEYAAESEFPSISLEIADKERTHSHLLKKDAEGKIPKDIKKAEAMKIQMSNFMHEQSQFCDTGRINVEQMKKYTKDTMIYFDKMLADAYQSGDSERTIYYEDCLELMSAWKNVNKHLKNKLESPNPQERAQVARKIVQEPVKTLNDVLDI